MRALVTGATGFVGRRLLQVLPRTVVLTRDVERARQRLGTADTDFFGWDPQTERPPAAAFEDVRTVFHLAGESIAEGRWNAAKKQRLRDSRIRGTQNLVAAIGKLPKPPSVLVSASAVGYYGDRGDQPLTEADDAGEGFLADLCVDWENAALQAREIGIRVVLVRIGIVLDANGGALKKMLPVFRMGAGSPLGSGRQWMPWIHLEDLVRLLEFAANHESLNGPVNGVAPTPTTNRDFTKALATAVRRPAFLPAVPGFALRLALGEFADALLASQRVLPAIAEQAGFEFQYAQLDNALRQLEGA